MSKTTVTRANPAKQFVQLPKTSIPRSSFDRSHGWKGAFGAGKLVPFFVDEVLPGDTFNLSTSMLARLSTPIVPFMDNLWLRTFFFFVPNRLVWEHWEAMNGDQRSGPTASTDYLVPQANISGVKIGSIGDAMGLPIGKNTEVTELPLRAYSLIWNEWFRDQNLQNAFNIDKNSQREYVADIAISGTNVDNPIFYSSDYLPVAKFHDYFTSALPWPQKGPGVEISLGGTVPVVTPGLPASGLYPLTLANTAQMDWVYSSGNQWYRAEPNTEFSPEISGVSGLNAAEFSRFPFGTQYSGANSIKNSNLAIKLPVGSTVDLSKSTPISINDLRQAFQIQKLYERDARGGTRYTEILRSHFGVVSPDARLQRPEYLGGGKTRINVNPVQQTSSTDEASGTPQGNLAAYAVAVDSRHSFTKSFVEHGFVIGLVCVQSDLTYQQGLNRMWSRKARFDYYWPVFAHLGEQAVLNKEIYCQGTEDDDKVFGYQERYAEYRYFPSQITGQLRSTSSTPLDVWHLAEKFDSLPTLSDQFIRDNTPLSRVVAVQDEPPIILDAWFDLKSVRPMPVYSTPGLVDHF
jgi:hypothetical protein